jgi:hypothetical protein
VFNRDKKVDRGVFGAFSLRRFTTIEISWCAFLQNPAQLPVKEYFSFSSLYVKSREKR